MANSYLLRMMEAQMDAKEDDIRAKYALVLVRSDMGREVLADILRECGMNELLDPTNETVNALRNLATRILQKCGLIPDDPKDFVDALAKGKLML